MKFPEITPENIQALATLFVLGFVFRHIEGLVRGSRKESDLTTTVLAVAWSLVIFALIQAFEQPIAENIPKKLHFAVSLASYIGAAAIFGAAWGYARLWMPGVSGYAQTIVNVIRASKDAYVEVQLGEVWYQGMIWHYDRDAERYLDLHFTLRHPAKLDNGKWVPIENVEEMMLSLRDVRVINRLKKLEAPTEAPKKTVVKKEKLSK